MSKRLLVIDREDQGQFFLSVEKGVMTIGGNSKAAEAILRDLHITRIHCEVEVNEDLVVVCNPENAPGQKPGAAPLRRELHPGEALHVGQSHLHLEDAASSSPANGEAAGGEASVLSDFHDDIVVEEEEKPAEAPASDDEPSSSGGARLVKQLLIIEGADRGRTFILPDSGVITIGKSRKNAEIVLHDLYVGRNHCQLEIEEDTVLVTHLQGDNGTLINGQKITEQQMKLGDVLRVGNSHLRLDIIPMEDDDDEDSDENEESSAVDAEGEEGDYEVEVVEEEADSEKEETEEDTTAESDDPYSTPHAPVDQLLKLEGQTLGHFQIGPLLGRGQSGLVFRALDTKNQQLVGLKVISPDFPAEDAELQRLVKALKMVTPLQNPHLLTLCGAGKTGHYCWIAREYVEGESVARLIQRISVGKRFEWTRACRVAVHLATILDFLHKHKVTHGNITPRNVLIRKSDRLTKLADLMLNRGLEGSRLQKAILGKKLLAELPYIAPEQTDPHAPGTPLGDIYSVGTVLYFLLTGEPPFSGETPRDVLAQVREGKAERPSKLQRGIPAPFEASVLLMMAKRPEDRFQTAAEMLDSVQRIADEHEVEL